jgi:hypothetical protein
MNRRVLRPLAAALLLGVFAAALNASSPRSWTVSTQADLLKGQADRLSIDYDGRLVLGPSSRSLFDPAAPFIWALAPGPNGSIYAGGGNDGLVWQTDRDGKTRVLFDAAELEVHALAPAPDGSLFVGTSPDGKVYRLGANGAASVAFDPEDKYIWALVVDGQGRLYVATGNKGVIYRVSPDGRSEVFFRTQTTHVTSLTIDRDGQILAGTESPGRILRITPAGKAFVLLDSPYREIRGLRVDPAGTVFAVALDGKPATAEQPLAAPPTEPSRNVPVASVSTEIMAVTIIDTSAPTQGAPPAQRPPVQPTAKGAVYRIDTLGASEVIWEFRDDSPFDLLLEDGGGLLVATGNAGRLYRLSGEPWRAMLVTRLDAQQVTSILSTGAGTYFATSNPARIIRLDSARASEGQYLSEARDAGTVATWGTLTWRATEGAPGQVRIFTRSGNTGVPDDTWSDWTGPYERAEGDAVKSPPARYFQWKAVLTSRPTEKLGPALVSLGVAYLQRNVRPRVTAITVHPPGIVFQKPYPAGDPEIVGMGDAPGEARLPAFSAPLGLAAQSPASGPVLGRRMYQKGLQAFAWKAEDENDDRLKYRVFFRAAGESAWKLLRQDAPDMIVTWDTMAVPDGTYVVKVAASDAPGNAPGQALVGEMESAAFDVDNGAPSIAIIESSRDGSGLKIVFDVSDTQSAVSTAEYSVDSGPWQTAYPVDGAADSRRERYEIRIGGSAAGRVVIRAADAMNNASTARTGLGAGVR